MKYYQKLQHLSILQVRFYFSNVLDLSRLPPNLPLFIGLKTDNLDNFLQNLALKTRNNPLSSLYIVRRFAVHDIQQFLQVIISNSLNYKKNLESKIF